ncbi:MAG: hypothetical protein AB1515_10830 [Nitrospirota bacterium]
MTISRRALVVVIGAALLAGWVWGWRACTEIDNTKILRVIEDGREAIQDKSIRGVMGLLAPDYRDNLGLTAESVKPMLQRLFLGVEAIQIDLANLSPPAIHDGTAEVSLDVAVSGSLQGQPIYLMGTPGKRARVTLALVRDDRRWLVREVQGLRLPELE